MKNESNSIVCSESRIGRLQYIVNILKISALFAIAILIECFMLAVIGKLVGRGVLLNLAVFCTTFPMLAALLFLDVINMIKRSRDVFVTSRNQRLLVIAGFIPYVSTIAELILCCFPGSKSETENEPMNTIRVASFSATLAIIGALGAVYLVNIPKVHAHDFISQSHQIDARDDLSDIIPDPFCKMPL